MNASWDDEEEKALQGLPLRAQIIYLRGIRRHMDNASRISGGPDHRITLTTLAKTIQESVNQPIHPKASKHAINASIEQLKQAGLLQRLPDPDYLLFLLPKAEIDEPVGYVDWVTEKQKTDPEYTFMLSPVYAKQSRAPDQQNNATVAGVVPAIENQLPDAQTRQPPPPYQEIVDLYHRWLPTLPSVYKLNDTRRRRIKALWDDELKDLPSWKNYFRHIASSDYLMGRITGRNGATFLSNFDFIIHPAQFIKIAEEQYHKINRGNHQ